MTLETSGVRVIEYLFEPSTEAVYLSLKHQSRNQNEKLVKLECRKCGAQFTWPPDHVDNEIPDRRHLNFCPGCGKTIGGIVSTIHR